MAQSIRKHHHSQADELQSISTWIATPEHRAPSETINMASVQIMSDLHLEAPTAYDVFEISPHAPYLALLGDIGNVIKHKDEYFAFLRAQLKQFQVVMLIAGNHEAYHSNWPATSSAIRDFGDAVFQDQSLGEFVYLDRCAYQLPGTNTTILGCSLFSHIPAERAQDVSMGLNDFYQTDEWDTNIHNAAHRQDLDWLNGKIEQLANDDESVQIFIFTHWSPTTDPRAVDPRHGTSRISSAFSTDLSKETCFQHDKVKLWAFGHTHYNCDFMFDRAGQQPLRVLANQRGYYFAQAQEFDVTLTIDI